MKCINGPYHIGHGISFSMINRHGIHETVTVIASSKELAEGVAHYLKSGALHHEAKPMITGTPLQQDAQEVLERRGRE